MFGTASACYTQQQCTILDFVFELELHSHGINASLGSYSGEHSRQQCAFPWWGSLVHLVIEFVAFLSKCLAEFNFLARLSVAACAACEVCAAMTMCESCVAVVVTFKAAIHRQESRGYMSRGAYGSPLIL